MRHERGSNQLPPIDHLFGEEEPKEQEISNATLDDLANTYNRQIEGLSEQKGLGTKTRSLLRTGQEFSRRHKSDIAISALLAPVLAQQLAEGYSLPLAVVKGIGDLMRSDPDSEMDPERARRIVEAVKEVDPDQLGGLFVDELVDIGDQYRAIVHQVLILAGVLKFAEHVRNSKQETKLAIEAGKAKIEPRGEQMFILGGSSSYVADALKVDNPKGTTVIYEDAGGGQLLTRHLQDEVDKSHPLFLNLEMSSGYPTYSGAPGWDNLVLRKGNLIQTRDGRNVLLVAGIDTANEDEWLGIQTDEHNVELDEYSTTVAKIVNKIRKKAPIKHEDIIGIWVGMADRKEVDEETGAQTTTHREIALQNGTDIYIDTWSVVLKSVRQQVQKHQSNNGREFPCGVRLISDVTDYHRMFGDVAEALDLPSLSKEEDTRSEAVLIVYEATSDKTIHTAKRRMREDPKRQVIAITSNIGSHKNALRQGINSICLAEVLANEVKAVREDIKSGKRPEEIQKKLDTPVNNSH